MAYEQRDDEGTLWPQDNSGPAGDGKFYGRDAYLMIGRTGAKSDAAPSHRLILIFKDDGSSEAIALFQPKKQIENLLLNGNSDSYFVSVWKNKSESGKTYFRVTFKAKDESRAPAQSSSDGDDDVPI